MFVVLSICIGRWLSDRPIAPQSYGAVCRIEATNDCGQFLAAIFEKILV